MFSAGRNATVLTETEALEAINYKPRHRESKKAYEEILSLIQQNIGDQPQVGNLSAVRLPACRLRTTHHMRL